jgi:hypothetical protein
MWDRKDELYTRILNTKGKKRTLGTYFHIQFYLDFYISFDIYKKLKA